MKTKFLTQLFLLAFVSLSLHSCTADSVEDTKQKNTVMPKVSDPASDKVASALEPNLIKRR